MSYKKDRRIKTMWDLLKWTIISFIAPAAQATNIAKRNVLRYVINRFQMMCFAPSCRQRVIIFPADRSTRSSERQAWDFAQKTLVHQMVHQGILILGKLKRAIIWRVIYQHCKGSSTCFEMVNINTKATLLTYKDGYRSLDLFGFILNCIFAVQPQVDPTVMQWCSSGHEWQHCATLARGRVRGFESASG